MKVKDLIKKLETFDPEMEVFVDGYEGGVDTPSKVSKQKVLLNVNEEDYYGSHEICFKGKKADCTAVIIER